MVIGVFLVRFSFKFYIWFRAADLAGYLYIKLHHSMTGVVNGPRVYLPVNKQLCLVI